MSGPSSWEGRSGGSSNDAHVAPVYFEIDPNRTSAFTVAERWPLLQNRPFSWEMSKASFRFVADAFMDASKALKRSGRPPKVPQRGAFQLQRASIELRKLSKARFGRGAD